MKKIQHVAISSVLLLALSIGLAGCGNSQSSAKSSSSSKDKVAKVTKDKKSSAKSSAEEKANSNMNGSNSDSMNGTSNTSANNNSSANGNTTNSQNSSSQSNRQATSTKQLGLNDVAVWTDSKGVTHHVDSDGMDRQTSNGQSGTTYQNWSGPLPDSAQIVQQK